MTEQLSDFEIYSPAAAKALVQIGYNLDECELTWLSGGGAHKNFMVTRADSQAVLKLWNTELVGVGIIPPPAVVMDNTRIAGQLGIGAQVLGMVQDPLSLLLEFVPSTSLTTSVPGWSTKLATAAKQLHTSGAQFNNDYSPFAEARKMSVVARHRDGQFPGNFDQISHELRRIERALDLRSNEFVPCHNDLYGANVLQTPDGQVRLIDYDLAGQGDPCYDLGFASAYFEMDDDTLAQFCEVYFGENNPHLVARVRLFSAAADWAALALWLVAGCLPNTNDDYDYAGEMHNSLRRLDKSLGSDWYGPSLAAAAR